MPTNLLLSYGINPKGGQEKRANQAACPFDETNLL